jgi:REP element-mobilizing transposase RayT
MARPLRLQFPGAIYHVTFRGVERRALFKDDADRTRCLQVLQENAATHKVRLFLVCLMSNHVHLLLETPGGNLSAFMGSMLTGYTVYFNHTHGRVGHLTQGRYKAQVVSADEYLLNLSRYIHLNPVHTRALRAQSVSARAKALRAYGWSTYRSYVGMEKPWPWIDYAPVLAMTEVKGLARLEAYRRYVEAGLVETDEAFREVYAGARLAVGSVAFQRDVEQRHTAAGRAMRRPEDVAFRRTLDRREPEVILRAVAKVFGVQMEDLMRTRRHAADRAAACWYLQREGGLTQREVAERLGLGSGAAVGYQIRQWKQRRQRPANFERDLRMVRELSGA